MADFSQINTIHNTPQVLRHIIDSHDMKGLLQEEESRIHCLFNVNGIYQFTGMDNISCNMTVSNHVDKLSLILLFFWFQ